MPDLSTVTAYIMPYLKIILDPLVLVLGFIIILGICIVRGKLTWFLIFLILGSVLVYFESMFKAMNFLS